MQPLLKYAIWSSHSGSQVTDESYNRPLSRRNILIKMFLCIISAEWEESMGEAYLL